MTAALTELFVIPGKTMNMTAVCDAKEICGYTVLSAEPFTLTLHHEKDRVFTLEGSGEVVLEMACSRCLKPVKVTVPFELVRKFDGQKGTDEDGEKAEALTAAGLDIDLLVLEGVSENMPMSVLCREDCKGLCPKCGHDLNEGPCGCDGGSAPTRMGDAIAQAFLKAQKKK